ncbi:putative toxin-antitoxin system toxin component, PIN family [uncultured Treponema sp.]|uniref:putative toxin-antitoxin system toxin component, PIN family n=1 Tax=uncultured Treponema sp. TaxID=162155 RepID=UPI0025F22B1A|nr:putative toxin-antitoxin system toxin component, PIN family [uncultured Treponema sp.]
MLLSLLSKNEDSATVKTIFKIFAKSIIPVFSKEIIAEYSEVLSRGKFKNKFSTKNVHKAIKMILDNGIELSGIQTEEKLSDPKDAIFYEVTMDFLQTKETFLATGNIKDFPVKPFVVTPKEMLEIMEENKKSNNRKY